MRTRIRSGAAYEFRRTWLRVPTLAIVVVGVAVALASASQIAVNSPGPSNLYSAVVFYDSGAYHFVFHAFNQYGNPLAGVNYNVTVLNTTGSGPIFPVLLSLSGNTPANGTLEMSATLPEGTYQSVITAGPQGGGLGPNSFWSQGPSQATLTLEPLPPESVVPILAPIVTAVDRQIGFAGEPGLQIFFPTLGGTCNAGCRVYFALVNVTSGPGPGPLPESAMREIGPLTLPLQTFSLTIVPNGNSAFLNLQVEIFSPTGSLLALDTNCTARSLSPYLTPASVSSNAFGYFTSDLILIIPLLAIATGFSAYAGDRLSGVLESSLAQPITRRALVVSRFLASTTALWVMIGIGMLASDELIHLVVGYYVLSSFLLSAYVASALVAVFFVGVVFLLSHAVRSVPVVFSTAFSLFLLFGVFWDSLNSFLQDWFFGGVGSPSAAALQVHLEFFNPLQFSSLVLAVVTNTTPAGLAQFGGSPASYGVTVASLGLAIVVWAVTPFALLLWQESRSD